MPTYRHATSERLNEETLNNEFNIPIIDDRKKLLDLNKFCKENHILVVIKSVIIFRFLMISGKMCLPILYIWRTVTWKKKAFSFMNLSIVQMHWYLIIHRLPLIICSFNRPLGFTLDDYKEYTQSRGWVFEDPLEYMPGEHIYDVKQFEQFLLDVKDGRDEYAEKERQYERRLIMCVIITVSVYWIISTSQNRRGK